MLFFCFETRIHANAPLVNRLIVTLCWTGCLATFQSDVASNLISCVVFTSLLPNKVAFYSWSLVGTPLPGSLLQSNGGAAHGKTKTTNHSKTKNL